MVPALLMCFATSLHAEVADSLREDLDEVVVTASRIDKQTIPAQELGAEELKRLSVCSVADALRYFSGVQIKDYGGIGGLKTVNVRSMGSEHVGVFYDGIQLGNAQNGTVDLGRYSLDNMESVSMYNGQKSSIFQPAKAFSSASTIYMQSRRPVFGSNTDVNGVETYVNDNVKAVMKYGSFSTVNPSALWEHRIDGRLSSSLSAEYLSSEGDYNFRLLKNGGYDTVMVRQNGDIRAMRLEASLYGNSTKDIWMLKAYAYSSERGYPGAVVRSMPGRSLSNDRQWDNNIFLQGKWQRSVTEWYSLQAQAKYSYDYVHYRSDPELDVSTMYVDNEYRQQEAYASAVQLFAITPWWSASLSTDMQMNRLDLSFQNGSDPLRWSALAAASTAFELGSLKGQASILYTFIDEKSGNVAAAGTKNKFTPSIALSWKPLDDADWNLRAFYKNIFRVPTLNELYYTTVGSVLLSPEYTSQYDIGSTWSFSANGLLDRLEIQADAYWNSVEDKIVALPSNSQFRWTMMNIGRVSIFGVDASAQSVWKVGGTMNVLRLTYSWQDARDITDTGSMWYGGQIPYIPWNSGSVAYGGDWRQWSWNYSFIYTGERYQSVANIPENYTQPWYTHDLSVSRHIPFRSFSMRATLEVNNIFNQQYEVVRCYPMPGTNWKLRIEFEL